MTPAATFTAVVVADEQHVHLVIRKSVPAGIDGPWHSRVFPSGTAMRDVVDAIVAAGFLRPDLENFEATVAFDGLRLSAKLVRPVRVASGRVVG